MKCQYEAIFQINIADKVPTIGNLFTELNKTMEEFGSAEKFGYYATMPLVTVTVARELTESEHYKMKRVIEAQVVESFSEYDIRLVEFRRKSGNVRQSVE